ncbi:MAG: hypothetical protein IPL78_24775 [Chloroflexi bacterium]|nr:hypothetical protein [Chloroflexota bacterium]
MAVSLTATYEGNDVIVVGMDQQTGLSGVGYSTRDGHVLSLETAAAIS